jgi:hypothetical protein
MSKRGFNRVAAATLLTLCLAACGGGGGGSPAPNPATPTAVASNPLEQALADADLTVSASGGASTGFNNKTSTWTFTLPAGNFGTTPSDISLVADGETVPADAIALNGNVVTALVNFSNGLSTGVSELVFRGSDNTGRLVHVHQRLLTGTNTVTVRVQDTNGAPVPNADVTLQLADAPDVRLTQTTPDGTATFPHLPSRTVLVEARATGGLLGVAGDVANNRSQIVVTVRPLDAAATGTPPTPFTVTTSGTVPQRLSKAFTTQAGTRAVTVRYRFATDEFAAGNFGSPYSDYYSVQLRSGSSAAVDTNTMNGLGLGAFDSTTGSTGWRTLRLPVSGAQLVQLDAVVANVNDAAFDSRLVIDRVDEESSLLQTQLQWDAAQGGVTVAVSLQGQALSADQPVKLYWATGTSVADIQGAAMAAFTLPQATPVGNAVSFHVDGSLLRNAPAQATHLLAVAGESASAALPDVSLSMGPSADDTILGSTVQNLLKEAARHAGVGTIVVAQTALTPAQQAHAMFLNLTRTPSTVAANIAAQQLVYGPEGDAVIQVFAAQTKDLSLAQVLGQQATIEALMATEIRTRGPGKVSAHCADPASLAVVDIRASSVPTATATLVKSFLTAQASKFADEANGLWHIEAAP